MTNNVSSGTLSLYTTTTTNNCCCLFGDCCQDVVEKKLSQMILDKKFSGKKVFVFPNISVLICLCAKSIVHATVTTVIENLNSL